MKRPRTRGRTRASRRLWSAALALLVIAAGFFAYSFIEPYRLQIKRYEFSSPQVPAEFDGVRIVLLADIHLGRHFSQERLRDLVDKVNGLQPDMVALAGDYVYPTDIKYMRSAFTELAGLRARLGRYAVLGNHDYGGYVADAVSNAARPDAAHPDATAAMNAIADSGIELLDNRGLWLDKGHARIRIGGVGDHLVGRPNPSPTIEKTVGDDFVILLSHNPDFAERLSPGTVDLMLSGHTHGGQLTFFGLFAPYIPSDYGQKYRTGMVEMDNTTVIVTNGIGSSIALPIRFFARPQIVEVTLRHASDAG